MKKYKKIIIDLRDNTGGSFDELKKVANMFLDQGKTIYQLDYIDKKEKYTSKNRNPLVFDKIVLLINNDTASVSELFVIALDENLNNVTKIGTNTYGKKVSYSIRSFKDKSAMIFINSIMEGANLKPIDADGIKPDIEIGHTEEYYLQIEDESSREKTRSQDKELQLNEALQFLKE
jgi:C-terminal processing protease CtpA/Prc